MYKSRKDYLWLKRICFILVFISMPAVIESVGFSEEADVNDEIDMISGDFNSLKQELAVTQEAYQRLKDEYGYLIKDLENKVNQLQNEKAGLVTEKGSLINEKANLQNEKAALQNDKANLEKQLKDLQAKDQAREAQAQQLNTALQEKDKALIELKGREQDLTKLKDDLTTTLKNYEAQITVFQNERGVFQKEKASVETYKISLEKQLKELEGKAQDWRVKFEEFSLVLRDRDKALAELKQSEEILLNQVQDNKSKLKQSWQLNDYLQEKNRKLFSENKALKQKVEEYSGKIAKTSILKERLLKDNSVAHYNLGVFYSQKQQYEEAISEFGKVLELNPNDAATHYNLGIVYAEYLNNKPKALVHFKRYLMAAPKGDKDVDRAKKYILTWESWEEEKVRLNP